MIQRIQSVYLLLAAIVMIVCSCMPIGTVIPAGELALPSVMYNLAVVDGGSGEWDFTVCGLLAILVCSIVSTLMTIFNFNNRKAQSRSCLVNMILMLLWIGLYAALAYIKAADGTFQFGYAAFLPLAAIVLLFLARKGILHDENLIKSMDRIR